MPVTPSASSTPPFIASVSALATTARSTTSPPAVTPSPSPPERSPATRPDRAGTPSPAGDPPTLRSSFPCSQLEDRSGELLGEPRPHRALQFYGRKEGSGAYRRVGRNAMGFEPPEPK